MKPVILLLLLALSSALCAAETDDWQLADDIERGVQLPRIPSRDFSIDRFGARSDERFDSRPAIQRAIERAHRAGGGRVVIPAGRWYSKGPLHLRSHIELHIEAGATLRFSAAASDYLPVVATRWEGTELFGYSPLIYAANVHDVAITGTGTIDGNIDSEFRSWMRQQSADQVRLRKMGIAGIPSKERVFGPGTYLRPSFIQIFRAERVLLSDFTLKDGPFWMNHLVYTSHATVRDLTVESDFGNNDGVDIDSSDNVVVHSNKFRTGDDGVVVKSGRDRDGRNIARPSYRIVVRNNVMSGEDAIAVGSEMSGGIKDVFFRDNEMTKGKAAIRFKANLDRGGTVEHVRVKNMKVGDAEHLIWFQLNYPGELGGGFPSTYRDIAFTNLTAKHVSKLLEARAPIEAPLRGLMLKDIAVEHADIPWQLDNIESVQLQNVRIGNQTLDATVSSMQR